MCLFCRAHICAFWQKWENLPCAYTAKKYLLLHIRANLVASMTSTMILALAHTSKSSYAHTWQKHACFSTCKQTLLSSNRAQTTCLGASSYVHTLQKHASFSTCKETLIRVCKAQSDLFQCMQAIFDLSKLSKDALHPHPHVSPTVLFRCARLELYETWDVRDMMCISSAALHTTPWPTPKVTNAQAK